MCIKKECYPIKKTNTAFTLTFVTVPARFGSARHGLHLLCKHNRTVPKSCRAVLARHG